MSIDQFNVDFVRKINEILTSISEYVKHMKSLCEFGLTKGIEVVFI